MSCDSCHTKFNAKCDLIRPCQQLRGWGVRTQLNSRQNWTAAGLALKRITSIHRFLNFNHSRLIWCILIVLFSWWIGITEKFRYCDHTERLLIEFLHLKNTIFTHVQLLSPIQQSTTTKNGLSTYINWTYSIKLFFFMIGPFTRFFIKRITYSIKLLYR